MILYRWFANFCSSALVFGFVMWKILCAFQMYVRAFTQAAAMIEWMIENEDETIPFFVWQSLYMEPFVLSRIQILCITMIVFEIIECALYVCVCVGSLAVLLPFVLQL